MSKEQTIIEIKEILTGVQTEGKQYFMDDSKIELLESCISECNIQQSLKDAGEQIVSDTVYDKLVEMLKKVKPESELLKHIWEEGTFEKSDLADKYNEQLEKHPMMSINTVKSYDVKEFSDFVALLMRIGGVVDLLVSFKLDGHGIRVVYENGKLVYASSRARASAGRDLTQQMKWLLGDTNQNLSGLGIVEIRGEVCLPFSNLERAREFNPEIKSAFTGVSSLIRPSTTFEEVSLLDFRGYRVYSNNLHFETREEEYKWLEENGFKTPEYGVMDLNSEEDIYERFKSVVGIFAKEYENYDLFCDGIVVEINDNKLAHSAGDNGRAGLNAVAMKVDVWGQDIYDGFVREIEWTKGKSKLSPVALVSENPEGELGVLTASGNTVTRVPLYEPVNILILNAFIGRKLKFKYGGEAGVVPLTQSGKLLTEAVATDLAETSFE